MRNDRSAAQSRLRDSQHANKREDSDKSVPSSWWATHDRSAASCREELEITLYLNLYIIRNTLFYPRSSLRDLALTDSAIHNANVSSWIIFQKFISHKPF
jgi:hypothetical protein